GDTAVAVHPEDERYKQYIGKQFTVNVGAAKPLTITIIADKNVDPKFGTGALGVTPAHSMVDYEMYQNNKQIGLIPVIGLDGRMTKEAGAAYEGLTVLEAREKFVEWLRAEGLLLKEEEMTHSVGTSERYGDVIEVLPMDQWFVDVSKEIPGRGKSLKQLMREAVTTGHNGDPKQKIAITPENFLRVYLHWVDNLKDWCISRQIWWGHRIPVWYRGTEIIVSDVAPEGDGWVQDEDTLDTWFSSGTWTFSTLGWPNKTADLKTYHPTSWMQMGYEILSLWMARMILTSTYALDEIPFRQVYIHGMLRDKQGKKFSKSRGNGIDPLDVIEQYGTDALRLSLIKGNTPGNDSKFYEEKVEDARNFVNKLWNISRYVLTQPNTVGTDHHLSVGGSKTLAERWIQSKLARLIQEMTTALNTYQFSAAAEKLYEFVWHDFADWYIEITKFQPNQQLVRETLETILKLAHPFIPFITEVIWQQMHEGELLMIQEWPKVNEKFIDQHAEEEFNNLRQAVVDIRNIRTQHKISYKYTIPVFPPVFSALVDGKNVLDEVRRQFNAAKPIIEKLARVIFRNTFSDHLEQKATIHTPLYSLTIDLLDAPADVAITNDEKQKKLEKEIHELNTYIESLKQKLANKSFVERAPEQVVKQEQDKLATAQAKRDAKQQELKNIEAIR
ncbi:MAG TPA: class I tRNA ligase family protein, partial [Patescibacteria group bacterium]|nr:class I tRNA ligase family protein [Patescibacteria group bacterium]